MGGRWLLTARLPVSQAWVWWANRWGSVGNEHLSKVTVGARVRSTGTFYPLGDFLMGLERLMLYGCVKLDALDSSDGRRC